ncbi:hypothetical protein ACH6EH_05795 [Paenibacillus sp. JSM ZJ436]|uniref:hypothetical protein n=1 Tax=Paenibacillus sp. JSM ZJ436 TaxID=3376190 RepID=UPI0037B52AEA
MMSYWFQDKTDNKTAFALFLLFATAYITINVPYLLFMDRYAELVSASNPFYGAKFGLNLFNFDPAMYFGYDNISVIHPYINIIAGPLSELANSGLGNRFFLILQSILNAASTALLFYILRRSGGTRRISFLIACLFGISSYSLFSSFIPDSYAYAQFGLLISVFFLQYYQERKLYPIWPLAALGALNFGITATNVIPYAGAVILEQIERKSRTAIKTLSLILGAFMIICLALALVQLLMPRGVTWVSSFWGGLVNGGFNYIAFFSVTEHWKAIYLLGVNPLLTPEIALINAKSAAIATDLSQPYPIYVSIFGFSFLILTLFGWIRGFREKRAWAIVPVLFIGFSIFLHLVVGYGLATFEYDLYLYAGHYWFACFLLLSMGIQSVRQPWIRKGIVGFLVIMLLVSTLHNLIHHRETLRNIEEIYVHEMK